MHRGKKREKKPQRLHEAEYSSSKRKPPYELYGSRPENLRCVKDDNIKNLVVDLQADNNPSMWVTLGEPSKRIAPHLTSI